MMTVAVKGFMTETALLFFRVIVPLMSASHGVLSSVLVLIQAIAMVSMALKNTLLLLVSAAPSIPNRTPPKYYSNCINSWIIAKI